MTENQPKIKVFVATPSMGVVSDMHPYFWRQAEATYGDRIEFIHPKQNVRRLFHDFARNAMVDEFLASDADVLFFLDSDVVPPEHVFDLILSQEKWTIAGAPYPVFMTPAGYSRPQVLFTAYRANAKGVLCASHVPPEGREFIEGLATGCLFIRREVFADLQRPYFEFKYDEKSRQMTEGEDLGFCLKAGAKGHKFLVDYGMVCKHYKNVCLLEINNYAMEYSNRSVNRYADMIKPQMQALATRISELKNPKKKIEPLIKVPDHVRRLILP